MSSFINKFFGFVKDVLTGKKKNIHEPEIIHELESEKESQSQSQSQPEIESQTEAKIESQSQSEIESKIESESKKESESKIESSSQDFTQEHKLPEQEVIYQPEPELEPESRPEPESKPQHEPKSESESQPEYKHELESQPELEPELQPEIEHEAQPEHELESESQPEYDYTHIEEKIRNIITQHYNYSGFMIYDTAGYSRFRTYARDYELELPASDSELRRLIIHSGTLIDGTVCVFSHDDVHRMLCEVQRMLDEGVSVIYFKDIESFIEDSNLYSNISDRRAVREILSDNYEGYIFTDLYMETPERKKFRSYMEGLKYILAKYFPEGFNSDYALLRKYADREQIILSGNDKALKREIDALRE